MNCKHCGSCKFYQWYANKCKLNEVDSGPLDCPFWEYDDTLSYLDDEEDYYDEVF